jgi:hypothetical protein
MDVVPAGDDGGGETKGYDTDGEEDGEEDPAAGDTDWKRPPKVDVDANQTPMGAFHHNRPPEAVRGPTSVNVLLDVPALRLRCSCAAPALRLRRGARWCSHTNGIH